MNNITRCNGLIRHRCQKLVVLVGTLCLSLPHIVGAAQPASKSTEERYYSLLDEAERLYSTGKLAEMSETLREISGLRVREVPTYEMHFYEALELAQQNRRDEALARLAAFRDMLRIDSGVAKCEATNGAISVGGVKKASSEAYNAMCAEAFIAYYDNPTYESLRRITRYWAFADDLRMKIERKT